jgi:hypothetical protein
MKILTLLLFKLRNAEHFQFMTEFANLVKQFGIDVMQIKKLFAAFLELLRLEDKSLVILQKSTFTEKMSEIDTVRESVFRGLVDTVNASINHFNSDVVEAGKRLKIVFDTYGNLSKKPNDEQTSGIYNLIQDLEGKFSLDVQKISATEWVAELKKRNNEYNELVRSRDTESSLKPSAKLKDIRIKIDRSYRDIISIVESLTKVSDDDTELETYQGFIAALNPVIERYRNRIAQREGVRDAKKREEKNKI